MGGKKSRCLQKLSYLFLGEKITISYLETQWELSSQGKDDMPATTALLKKFLFGVLTFLTSLFLIFLLIFIYYLAGSWDYYQRHRFQSGYSGDSLIQKDSTIGYAVRPSIMRRHTVPPVYTVYTDERGARVGRSGVKAPDQVDFLAVGDSYTWGEGINDESTFIKILGRQKNLVVSNVAVPGYGITGCLLTLKKFLLLKPRVVIFPLIENDIRRSIEPCAPNWSPYCLSVAFVDFDRTGRPFIHPAADWSEANEQYLKEILMEHPFGLRDIFWAVRRDWLRLSQKDQDSLNRLYRSRQTPEFKEKALTFLLEQMAQTSRKISAKLLIVYLPVMNNIQPAPSELLQAVMKLENGLDVFYTDLAAPFAEYVGANGDRSLKAGGVDVHPSETAHQLIADQLAPLLDEMLHASGTPLERLEL